MASDSDIPFSDVKSSSADLPEWETAEEVIPADAELEAEDVVETPEAEEVVETTTDVMDDMRENGKYWVETVSQKVKETVDNFDVAEVTTEIVKATKANVKTANKVALGSADYLIDMTLDNGKKIQNLSAKALDGGFKIAAKQQDIVFTTLETLKGQLTKNASRFKDLFNMN